MKSPKSISNFLLIVVALLLWNTSCQDPLFDINKGINTEVKVGGDSISFPLGTTDTLRIKDFLNAEDLDFLKIMEDGGYGMNISDSMKFDDLLKSIDRSKLRFNDQIFNQNIKVNFGDIDVSEFKIPGYRMKDTLDMNIPDIKVGDISPNIQLNKNFEANFANYVLDDSKLVISDQNQNTRFDNLVANVSPLNQYMGVINPEFTFSTPSPIDVGNLSITINYVIEVPAGVTSIHQIDLDASARMEISLALDTAVESLSAGLFTPNIQINPSDFFKFSPLTPLTNGRVTFDNANALNNFNSFTSTKTYNIIALHNLPAALNNQMDLSKMISVEGTINAQGTVRQNKVQEAKKIDLVVTVVLKDLKINNFDFEIPSLKTQIDGSADFTVSNNSIPSQINRIHTVSLEKQPNSPLNTNLVMYIRAADLPAMKNSNIEISNFEVHFPPNFTLRNISGKTYSARNVVFDPVNGYRVEIDVSEINLSSELITNGVLNWTGSIQYSGEITFKGRMNSKDIISTSNPKITLNSQSAIRVKSISVGTNVINETITNADISANLEVDISQQVARLGVINVKPGCFVRVNINRPALPLNLQANGIRISFSDMFEFQPHSQLSQNAFTINGPIPDFIELELKALHINKPLQNGKLSLHEKISISGGITLQPGNVNSLDIEELSKKNLIFEAVISDLFIESTSLEMNTLEADFKDKTALQMTFDNIPTEILALDSVLIKEGSTLKLNIQINNMPNLGNKPLNANLRIKFPSMLRLGSGQVNAANELLINEPFVNGRISKEVNLKALKFDGSNLNGKISIDEIIDYEVKVSVENPTINSADLDGRDISVDVNVALRGLEFASVFGRFNVDMDDLMEIPEITLDDIPDILRDKDVVLDIARPVIALSAETNIGIPVNADIKITKITNGVPQNDNQIAFTLAIPKSPSPSRFTNTGFWISPSSSGILPGYIHIERNIQNLFKPLPDKLKLDLKPVINTQWQHHIDFSANYKMNLKYNITVPFSFGKDFKVVIRDTIDNIQMGLDDIDLNSGKLQLLGKISNSIPLDLSLQMLLFDQQWKLLSTTTEQLIRAGAPNGSAVDTNIDITLADSFNDVKKINRIILTFKASSNATIAGTPIKPENFIKASLKARVNDGITVNLNP